MLVNALCGHLAEFGLIEAQGLNKVARLITIVMDEMDGRVPDIARLVLKVIVSQIKDIRRRIAEVSSSWPRLRSSSMILPCSSPCNWCDRNSRP